MKTKTFKTLDEQIDILTNKGLTIEDITYTKEMLLRENYFFLSGYRHLFLDPNNHRSYIEGTTFKELYAMFSFDRQIRNIIFKNILIVENNLKSILSYTMSKNHGFKENNYLNPNNFVRDSRRMRQINDLIRKMKRQINVNGKQHAATAHYLINYGYIPLWVVVKVLSFGIVSELYTILQYQDQKEIADTYGIEIKKLVEYLPILANYRNLCAHEDICYCNRTQKIIDDTKYHQMLYIPLNDVGYTYGKNDLFAVIIILKQLLDRDDFTLLISEINYELERLSGKLQVIKIEKVLHAMGFPNNFKEIVRMD